MWVFDILFGTDQEERQSRRYVDPKTYVDDRGYYRFSNSDKLVHRWVAEKMLGRRLKKHEVVHHMDRNKLNNNESNLHVFKNQSQHDYIHKLDAKRKGFRYSYIGYAKR